jgi:hypothetical protein
LGRFISIEQRKELDNTTLGPQAPDSDEDINKPDSDKSMSGNPTAGGSGGGGAPGGGGRPPGAEAVEAVEAVEDYHQ